MFWNTSFYVVFKTITSNGSHLFGELATRSLKSFNAYPRLIRWGVSTVYYKYAYTHTLTLI